MEYLSRWLVRSAAESARHYALRGSTECCWSYVTWFFDETHLLLLEWLHLQTDFFLGFLLLSPVLHLELILYGQMRCVYFTGKIVWKIRMDLTEMKVQAVCFTFTRTLRSKHVAQPSVYARTKEKNSVSLLLENLMFFPNISFFLSLSTFEHASAVLCFLCHIL